MTENTPPRKPARARRSVCMAAALAIAAAYVGVYVLQRRSPVHSIEMITGIAAVIVAMWGQLVVELRLRRMGVWRPNRSGLRSPPTSVMRMIHQLPAGDVKRGLLTLHLVSLGTLLLVMLISFSWISG